VTKDLFFLNIITFVGELFGKSYFEKTRRVKISSEILGEISEDIFTFLLEGTSATFVGVLKNLKVL